MSEANKQTISKQLAKCPFCGGEAMLKEHTDYWGIKYGVECQGECDVSPFTSWWKHKEDAIKAWNTRIPMHNIVERLEKEMQLLAYGFCEEYFSGVLKGIMKAIEIAKEEGGLNELRNNE